MVKKSEYKRTGIENDYCGNEGTIESQTIDDYYSKWSIKRMVFIFCTQNVFAYYYLCAHRLACYI